MITARSRGVVQCPIEPKRLWRGRAVRRAVELGAVAIGALMLSLGGAACARARAETVPDGPPLVVPEPPPRVLAPVEVRAVPDDTPEPMPAPVVEAPASAPSRPVRQPQPRPLPRAEASEVPASPGVGGDLRAGAASATESDVRAMLIHAARDRASVDTGRLSSAGRSQYEQSERFTAQAQGALRDRNLIFAATLAEKAAALAAELVGR